MSLYFAQYCSVSLDIAKSRSVSLNLARYRSTSFNLAQFRSTSLNFAQSCLHSLYTDFRLYTSLTKLNFVRNNSFEINQTFIGWGPRVFAPIKDKAMLYPPWHGPFSRVLLFSRGQICSLSIRMNSFFQQGLPADAYQ